MEVVQVASLAEPRPGFDREDVVGLTAIIAAGALLSWLCAEYPAELPYWAPWGFSWVEFLAAGLGVWWYLRGIARTPPAERPRRWRLAAFLVGVGAIYAVVQTHYEYLALHEFFLNRVQHIFMHHLGPFFIALSWPGAMLKRGMPAPFRRMTESRVLAEVIGFLQQPVLAALLFVGLIYLFLVPAVQFAAMIDPRLYALMNWLMIGDGILFWCLVLDPRPKDECGVGFGTRMVLPVAVMFPQIGLGAYIAFGPPGLYRYYELCGRLFPSISAAYDQQIGGLIAWIPAAMMSAVGFVTVLNAFRLYEDSLPEVAPGEHDDPDRVVVRAASWTGR